MKEHHLYYYFIAIKKKKKMQKYETIRPNPEFLNSYILGLKNSTNTIIWHRL